MHSGAVSPPAKAVTVDSAPKQSDRFESSVAAPAGGCRAERAGLHADGATRTNQTSGGAAEKDQSAADPAAAPNNTRIWGDPPPSCQVCAFENAACSPLRFVCAFVNDTIKPKTPQTTTIRWQTHGRPSHGKLCCYEKLSQTCFCQGNVLACQLKIRTSRLAPIAVVTVQN